MRSNTLVFLHLTIYSEYYVTRMENIVAIVIKMHDVVKSNYSNFSAFIERRFESDCVLQV